jgi:hypothetical protein
MEVTIKVKRIKTLTGGLIRMKSKKILGIFVCCMMMFFVCPVTWAEGDLNQQLSHILEQNRMLQERLHRVEQELSDMKTKHETQDQQAAGEDESLLQKINDRVAFSGVVEVEAFARNGYEDEDESDITLATVELGFDVAIAEWMSAHILLLWEEDDTEPMDLDEGTLTIGNTKKYPLYVTAGKLYVPFGNFESNMIQDPLTLEIGETRESAIQVGLEASGFYGSIYAFNGDVNETGKDETIQSFGANLGYAYECDAMTLDIGAGWINSIADSDGLTDVLPGEIDDYVGGLAAHAIFSYGPFTLIGEYVGATDSFKDSELDFKGRGAEPQAWNLELAYTHEIAGKETVFALAYQSTDEAVALELPEDRYMAAIGIGIFENTTLAFEYLHDEDYSEKDGGTGEDANQLTMQLAVEF